MTKVDYLHSSGSKYYCHLFADTVAELINMARRLKVPVKVGIKELRPHLDLTEHQRELAIQYGAVEEDFE